MAIYDCDIRQALLQELISEPEFNNDDTYIVNELDICGGISRADIAIINGKIHGYEIKSQQDNLDRLASQIESYNQIFDTMTLVTCEKHLKNVSKLVPSWWGIYCVTGTHGKWIVKKTRQPRLNKDINKIQLAQLLWKDELIELLCTRTSITRGLKSKSRYALAVLVSQNLSVDEINNFVRETLKHRQDWRAVQLIELCGGLH